MAKEIFLIDSVKMKDILNRIANHKWLAILFNPINIT